MNLTEHIGLDYLEIVVSGVYLSGPKNSQRNFKRILPGQLIVLLKRYKAKQHHLGLMRLSELTEHLIVEPSWSYINDLEIVLQY